jgi:antitoxin (DNA-binding transcriptional repressor) of toxin-antitoxin stability system
MLPIENWPLKICHWSSLRTDFRAVKRRLEQHGEVVITDHGPPAYVIRPLPQEPKKKAPLPDYYARLHKRQPTPLSIDASRQFWEQERE